MVDISAGRLRGDAGPASDPEEVWDLLRSLYGAGASGSANLAAMANERLKAAGLLFDFDCRMMSTYAHTVVGFAALGHLTVEPDVRDAAKTLLPRVRPVIRADKQLVRRVLRRLYGIGPDEQRSTLDDYLFAGGVIVGIAAADTTVVEVDAYREPSVTWFHDHWTRIAKFSLPD